MIPFDAAMMPSEIILGFLDENHWRPQPFDCSSFLEKHPGGIMTLWVQPHGAAQAFPVALERDGNIFTWTPLDEEITARQGKLQLMCVDGTDNGEVFTGCQIFYGSIEIDSSTGIRFVGANIGRAVPISVTNSKVVSFSDCTMFSASEDPITQSGNTAFVLDKCYYYDGSAVSV